ncbi:MAG: hydrogenase maturation nickel metallochaperone HypA [Candidatus Hydrogenedentes bacterium]|nr:hydrogenase maturation nickel metallochaperone HypA [Candidatus Hydrogenedentota bacterium]
MHELSLLRSVLHKALEISREHGNAPITQITLQVGALRLVDEDLFQFAFDASTPDTPAAGATLCCEKILARVLCTHCESVFPPSEPVWQCPGCGRFGGRVLEGDELILKSVTLADASAGEE